MNQPMATQEQKPTLAVTFNMLSMSQAWALK